MEEVRWTDQDTVIILSFFKIFKMHIPCAYTAQNCTYGVCFRRTEDVILWDMIAIFFCNIFIS